MKFTRLLPRYDQAADMSTASSSIDAAKKVGENAINSFDPATTAGAQKTNLGESGLGGLLTPQTTNYVNDYTKAVANNPTVTSLYNAGNTMFNVPGLAKTATDLQNRLTDVTPNAYAGARGYDIDKTDIDNGVANATAYLGPQSGRATANYNTAAGLASNFVNAGIEQNKQNLLPVQAQGQFVLNQEAAQATGWNQASHDQLQGLIAKMQSGVALSTAEMDTAQKLAATEEAYNAVSATNTANIQEANIKNNFIPVSQNDNLFSQLTNSFVNPTITNPSGFQKLPA